MRNKIIESDLKFITKASLPWKLLKGKTLLISGASGFLPSYMVEALLYLNESKGLGVKVLGLVRNIKAARLRFSHYKNNNKLRLIHQDVCSRINIKERIHYIIHAASQATPKVFSKDPVGTIKPNIIGTANLLDLAVTKKLECFLFFSTTGVYGHVNADSYPIKESCFGYFNPTQLSSCYIESKRMGENMCVAWMHQHGVPVKIVRPAITYGPGLKLDDGRSFADFVNNIVRRQDIELFSDGKARRSFCYIADAIVGFFSVMLKGKAGEAYNIASEEEISIIDLARFLTQKVFPERKLKIVRRVDGSKDYIRVNFKKTNVDISRAKALGWSPSFSLGEGFRRTVESFEA